MSAFRAPLAGGPSRSEAKIIIEMKKELKRWREQTHQLATFKNGSDELLVCGVFRLEGDSPNGKRSASLVFFGDTFDSDGEVIRRRLRYDITGENVASIVAAVQSHAPYENDRAPEIARERFVETVGGFVVSLKQTPEKTLLVIAHPEDGWRFEAEDRNRFFEAFAEAAR